MKREELIQTLNDWKNAIDPAARSKNYSIVKFKDNSGEYEHVIIALNREYFSFNISFDVHKDIFIEDANPRFLKLKELRTYLYGL